MSASSISGFFMRSLLAARPLLAVLLLARAARGGGPHSNTVCALVIVVVRELDALAVDLERADVGAGVDEDAAHPSGPASVW